MAVIVEGHGEVEAVPVLIRRIAAEVVPRQEVLIKPILRVPANRLIKQGELERTVETIPDPESIRGAKEWLSARMPRYRPYTETLDQPALTQCFDIQAARRTRSFDKCYREIRDQLMLLQSKST
jgi:hypothetical protein